MSGLFLIKDDNIWILNSAKGVDYLAKIDITTKKVNCEYVFEESNFGRELFSDMVAVGNKILFVPKVSENIYLYSLNEKIMQKKKIKKGIIKQFEASYTNFANAVVIDDCAFLVPHKYPAMIKVDSNNMNLEYIDCFAQDILDKHSGGGGFFERGIGVGNLIHLLCNGSNNICEYNIENGDYHLKPIGDSGTRLSDLCFDGINYWMVDNDDRVLKKNTSQDEIEVTFDYNSADIKKTHDNQVWNKRIIYINNAIWLFSHEYPIIKIDCENMEYKIISDNSEEGEVSRRLNYVDAEAADDCIYALKQCTNEINAFNVTQSKMVNNYSLIANGESVLKAFIEMVSNL
ncbi:hypothetical protein [Butyrivibrio sp. INlla21]|uniref:hypothetical protein n=1 Tax=Butyrivibrio sp. INlla21 TaxID=1520811 RepID=UPI0008EE0C13|nr:hypothetical protein [Butyrivibrio sp. INlla21]SFU65759.1 hypothetical protein SAMN02910342_01251 [Butyrivibrio sp. INlla21]